LNTVFSHIVQKRLSQESENVATEALAFIVNSSEDARRGLMKLLRSIAPKLPELRFRTQQTEGTARPDMWGLDGFTPRVFIENKFWAGLTKNQPVEYLKLLSYQREEGVLLVIVPEARLETVWRAFANSLQSWHVSDLARRNAPNIYRAIVVDFDSSLPIKPVLAIASWTKLLSALNAEMLDDPIRRNDLAQLCALCDAADEEYVPFSKDELTCQRTPHVFLQLNAIVQQAVEKCVTHKVLNIKGLNSTHFWEAHGRYVRFPGAREVGAWFGTHFKLWRAHGATPLWLYFRPNGFGRAFDVRLLLEPWAEKRKTPVSLEKDGGFAIGIILSIGEDPETVIANICEQITTIAMVLSQLEEKPLTPSSLTLTTAQEQEESL
jgi:hypothetical protein